jgi:hypothetical protein
VPQFGRHFGRRVTPVSRMLVLTDKGRRHWHIAVLHGGFLS